MFQSTVYPVQEVTTVRTSRNVVQWVDHPKCVVHTPEAAMASGSYRDTPRKQKRIAPMPVALSVRVERLQLVGASKVLLTKAFVLFFQLERNTLCFVDMLS